MGQNAGPDGRDAGRPLQIRSLYSDLIFSNSNVSSSSEDGRTVKPDYRLEKTLPHRPALHPSRPSDASQLLPMVSPSLKASIVPICGLPAWKPTLASLRYLRPGVGETMEDGREKLRLEREAILLMVAADIK